MWRSLSSMWMLAVLALIAVSSPLCAQERPPRPLAAPDIKIPPRQRSNGYAEPDHPFRYIPERF